MTASEITWASGPKSTVESFAPTHDQLTKFHFERRRLNNKGEKRPEQSLKNERTAIEGFLDYLKLGPADPVGEELGVRFIECSEAYLSSLSDLKGKGSAEQEVKGLAGQTIKDRRTVLNKYRESFIELQKTNGLPQDFSGALKELVERADTSASQLRRVIGIRSDAIYGWIQGRTTPSTKSLKHIRKLEKALKVSPGVLSSRLPDAHWSKSTPRCCTTAWRSHLSTVLKLVYRLPPLIGALKEEWVDLERCYTDPEWASERGLELSSEWRIRWNTNRCPTSELYQGWARSFYGFLCLPVTATDKRIGGLGFSMEDLTLGLFSDSDLGIKFLHFLRGRSVSGTYNSGSICFLNLGLMLTRDETGYLRQLPEFGAKLPRPVAESEWPGWCEENHRKYKEFKAKISGEDNNGKKGKRRKKGRRSIIKVTRDPFEPVRDIIRERQHPITALFDLSSRLESLTPLLERGSEEVLACHGRSVFQVRLIGSNPLRGQNFSMMTHIPVSLASFERAREVFRRCRDEKRVPDLSELYVETAGNSNLYQNRDGSWRLRFDDKDFKHERGGRNSAYDVPVVPTVWPALMEYLFVHRPVLNEAIRDSLRKVRAVRGLSAMTPKEEQAITGCRYVFRPAPGGVNKVSNDQLMAGYGTGQMSVRTLSGQIFLLTSRYLPESKGFCAHACRHLVATEYIKNHPDGWVVAAVALHNTVEMVKKHYSWVEVGDLIKPWNTYHEDLHAKYDRGEM